MAIGTWRRLILYVSVAAVLGLAALAVEWQAHAQRMGAPGVWPEFAIRDLSNVKIDGVHTDDCDIPFGRIVEAVQESSPAPSLEPDIERLSDLGHLTGSVIAANGGTDGIRSSITFRRKDGGIRTIAQGEALETRPHPVLGPAFQLPVRYCFVGCEREDGEIVYLFDAMCDGTRMERLRWPVAAEQVRLSTPPESRSRVIVMDEKELERELRRTAVLAPAPPGDKRITKRYDARRRK